MIGARELWHVNGWRQGDGIPWCMLGTGFLGNPTPKYGTMHMMLAGANAVVFLVNHDFPRHIYFVHAINITDTCNPDTGVRTVFTGRLLTIRRIAVGRMTSSASEASCVGIAMAQDFFKNVEHITFWWYEHRFSMRRIAWIHKLFPFQWLIKCSKGQSVTLNIHGYFSKLSNFLMTAVHHTAQQYLRIP